MNPKFFIRIFLFFVFSFVAEAAEQWFLSYQQGILYMNDNDWSMAEKQLQQSIVRGPKTRGRISSGGKTIVYIPEYHLGVIYFRQEKYLKALNEFGLVENSGLIRKDSPEYVEMNELARQAREKVQQSTGNGDVSELLESARSLFDQQRYQEARAILEEARQKDPANPQIPYLFSLIYKHENELRKRQEVGKMIQDARLYMKQENLASARKILDSAKALDPMNVEIRTLLEEIEQKSRSADPPADPPAPLEAPVPQVKDPAAPVESVPEKQAIRAFYQGQYEESIKLLLASENTNSARWNFYLGCSYAGIAFKTGNNKVSLLVKAREHFQKSREIDPSMPFHNKYISRQISNLYLNL